jgi:hypothetical protein
MFQCQIWNYNNLKSRYDDFRQTEYIPCLYDSSKYDHLRITEAMHLDKTLRFSVPIVAPEYQFINFFHEKNTNIYGIVPMSPDPLVIIQPGQELPLEIVFQRKILPLCLVYFNHEKNVLRCTFCKDDVVNVDLECKAKRGYHELLIGDHHGGLKVKRVFERKQGDLVPIELSKISILNTGTPIPNSQRAQFNLKYP